MSRNPSMQRRVVVSLILLSAGICLVYGSLAFMFVYSVEDQFFSSLLEVEAEQILREEWAGRGALPRLPFITRHDSWESVPPDLRTEASSPDAREVSGEDGRHYHIHRVALREGDAWLVAEVGSLLVVRPMRTKLLEILIPATGLILICSALVAVLLARRTVAQLTALVEVVERPTPPFPHHFRSGITDHEVGVLADALDAAFTRVKSLLEREQAFVGDVSHELRTPLAIIRGAAELLAAGELVPSARAQLDRILDAAGSSEEIIQLMLALAREETTHEEAVELSLLSFVEKLLLRHRDLAGREEIEISVDIAPHLRVLAPRAAAEVIISNLIANALRHGGGSIEISGKGLTLLVRNGGREDVTDGLGQGSARPSSAGIGLNLVRRLCAASGLRLTFDSSASAGATASVQFPS